CVCCGSRVLVEDHASHWKLPLPQLRILEVALQYFSRASAFFTSNCDHVLHTLSSLAFEYWFHQCGRSLVVFSNTPSVFIQECHSALAKHQNVHLHQVERWVQGGGPWASHAFQAILRESSLPQKEVEECIGCELPVFLELRVRYLLSCERLPEALALAKCCAQHPTAGQHLFFLQVYLTWLYKTSQHERLHKEVCDFNGEDAVHIICSLECEEKDELLLALNRAFLSQQLRRGDMYYLCDLVSIWSKLHSRLKTSKQTLLKECHQLMLSATNVNSIFPFIRIILAELGEGGVQFCVELCANALKSCLLCDAVTKSLIYKTIASLLPNDLEVCRACALLVFFLERTVDAYKMVYLLYMHPDQEYHVDCSPIGNHIRFETLQILKKDLYFDPEFWNLIALRTNCLKLMSEKPRWLLEDSGTLENNAPLKSTSSCSQQQLSAQEESEDAEDDGSEYGDHVETEESKLLYTCTFCHKVFKGSRVVAHAMFHYRKDECMFCGVMFKDDLLAMMHLSDHIEKLKKLKETTRNKSQESHTSKSKDMSKHKTSAKTKTTNVSSGHRNSERLKKSTEVPKTKTVSESSPPKSRKLRCNDRLVRTPLTSGRDKTENLDPGTSTSTQVKKEPVSSTEDKIKGTESQPLKTTANQNKQLADKNHVELQEKLCCPVDGCTWFTDMLKNRVALLYHALEDHHGDDKPLELAFRVGNGKCSICTRVLYSFEHFQHHVERHRLTPRHPCLHLGCTARFKSGMEMRRHARRHSPLQAVCCLPGCPQLFICLWALNLHEKDHYSSKSTKSVPNVQSGDKHKNPEFEKKTECHKPKSAVADLAVKKKKSVKKHRVRKTKDKNTETKRQKKTGKTRAAKAVKKVEAKASQSSSSEGGEKVKEETLDADGSSTSMTANASDPVTCRPLTSEENQSSSTAEGQEGKCPLGGPSGPGYSIMVNGQLTSEDKSAALKDAFAQFRKRPYMRLPPTAYLDEKYITMPKRRKEMSMFPESQKSPPLEQASAAASLQRQRCVNCFTTFNTAEELQSHLQLQKCTNLFGFDSDDEGE
uniref:C2H2-type domain-containing protein n=1 Tax=Sphaeramia orbicularis TaxID=375764 RepID=A0A673B0V6_9TELE